MPGKRKRETTVVSRDVGSETDDSSTAAAHASHDVFRHFFESKFQPLDLVQDTHSTIAQEPATDEDSEEESEGEWQGITDEDEQQQVEVIEHTDAGHEITATLDKRARKAFMVSSSNIHGSYRLYFDIEVSFHVTDGEASVRDQIFSFYGL